MKVKHLVFAVGIMLTAGFTLASEGKSDAEIPDQNISDTDEPTGDTDETTSEDQLTALFRRVNDLELHRHRDHRSLNGLRDRVLSGEGQTTPAQLRHAQRTNLEQKTDQERATFPVALDSAMINKSRNEISLERESISLERDRRECDMESRIAPFRLSASCKKLSPSFSTSLESGSYTAVEQIPQVVLQTIVSEATKDGYSWGKNLLKPLFQSKEDRLLEEQMNQAMKSKAKEAAIQQLEADKRLLITFKQLYEKNYPEKDYPELHNQLLEKINNVHNNQLKLLGLDPEEVLKKEEHDTVNKLTSDENLTDLAEELEGDSSEYTDVDSSPEAPPAA